MHLRPEESACSISSIISSSLMSVFACINEQEIASHYEAARGERLVFIRYACLWLACVVENNVLCKLPEQKNMRRVLKVY